MARDYLRVAFFVQELEEANGKIICDLVFISRLANISLGIMARASAHRDEDIEVYFHTRKTLDRLQREAVRQTQLLEALKKELIHGADREKDAVPPCVLYDYEKAEAV